MNFSETDLIRKKPIRILLSMISLVFIITGTRHFEIFRNWKGIVVLFMGVGLLFLIINAYEELLYE